MQVSTFASAAATAILVCATACGPVPVDTGDGEENRTGPVPPAPGNPSEPTAPRPEPGDRGEQEAPRTLRTRARRPQNPSRVPPSMFRWAVPTHSGTASR